MATKTITGELWSDQDVTNFHKEVGEVRKRYPNVLKTVNVKDDPKLLEAIMLVHESRVLERSLVKLMFKLEVEINQKRQNGWKLIAEQLGGNEDLLDANLQSTEINPLTGEVSLIQCDKETMDEYKAKENEAETSNGEEVVNTMLGDSQKIPSKLN